MDYVVGCDVGSQGVKAVLLSVTGQLLGEASAGYAIEYPRPTWAEQPAEVWLTAIAQAVGALRATTGVAPGLRAGRAPPHLMSERLAQVRCFLLDMDGTFYLGVWLYTDIALGQTSGITTVLVFTSETRPEDLADSPFKPTYIFDHLGAVADWLSAHR